MLIFVKVFWCSAILVYFEGVSGDYANSTISTFKMIGDDFREYQQTGQRNRGRDGRKFVTFDTKNNNIEVYSSAEELNFQYIFQVLEFALVSFFSTIIAY